MMPKLAITCVHTLCVLFVCLLILFVFFFVGDEAEIGNQCSPPVLGDISSWLKEAEQLRKDIYKAKKAGRDLTLGQIKKE